MVRKQVDLFARLSCAPSHRLCRVVHGRACLAGKCGCLAGYSASRITKLIFNLAELALNFSGPLVHLSLGLHAHVASEAANPIFYLCQWYLWPCLRFHFRSCVRTLRCSAPVIRRLCPIVARDSRLLL